MKNTDRLILGSIRRYCERRGLSLELLSHDWIARLTLGERSHVVFGYDLGINSSTAAKVANDKAAAFQVLSAAGVPAVEHRVFVHPRLLRFLPIDGNWAGMMRAFADFGCDAILKDNEGTGGIDVHRVRSEAELELRAHELFQIARGIAISPYLPIEQETRFVLIDGEPLLAYRKERASVIGDGRTPLGELIARSARNSASRIAERIAFDADLDLLSVPAMHTTVPLQWRHNLGLGAKARLIDPNAPKEIEEAALARSALQAVGLRFASVDVVRAAGCAIVLEINSGVMLELAGSGGNGSDLADRIYHRVLDLIFA
jgi:glutathione synthase/RimK-type ligase-like ATP-grasp enzyme